MKRKKRLSCGNCQYNPEGFCVLCNNREVPIAYVLDKVQKPPKWCPLSKPKEE